MTKIQQQPSMEYQICSTKEDHTVNNSDARRKRSQESGVKKQNRETVDVIDGLRRFECDDCGH